MPPNFPTSLDALANPTPTTLRNAPGFSLSAQVSMLNDIVEALEAKLGIGASTPGATAGLLRRTAAGTSAWQRAVAGDLTGAGIGDANTVLRTTDGTAVVMGKVQAGDIAAGAVGMQLITAIGPIVANQISFDFTAIPQTYRSLRIVMQARSSAAATTDQGCLRINGSSSSLYFDQTVYGAAAIAGAIENLGTSESRCIALTGNTAPGSYAGTVVIDIPNYAAPAGGLVKTWVCVGHLWYGTTTGLQQTRITGGGYSGTPAITQVTLFPLGGQLMPGSYAALYGLQ